jgi:hypothetical protein
MHIFELNDDVLERIISVTNREDLLQLAATNHSAYDICIPHILSTIRLTRTPSRRMPYRVQNFCQFMLAQPTGRILHMRHFSFNPTWLYGRQSDPHATALGLLADVLDQARNLQSFEVQSCERLLTLEPRIADALARCTRLTRIGIDNDDVYSARLEQHSVAMMQRLSSVRHVNLGFTYPQNLLSVLSALPSTLSSLSFICGTGYGTVSGDVPQWINVQQLKLYVRVPPNMNIAHIFPNVRELRVDGDNNRQLEGDSQFSCRGWSQLDYVEGPMPVLRLLGLEALIRELKVHSLTHNEPKHIDFDSTSRITAFLDLVRVASPVALTFAVDLRSKLADLAFFEALAKAAPVLKFLAISVTHSKTVVHDLVST